MRRWTTIFTKRQDEIFTLLVQGYSPTEIAQNLNVSLQNVSRILHKVYAKLGVQNAVEAIRVGLQRGLLCLDDMKRNGQEEKGRVSSHMSKFTPGKWIYYPPSENNAREGVTECDIFSVQGNIGHFIGTINSEEDARLIAAAPELYQLLMDELLGEAGGILSFAREAKIRAVLDKIDGKEVQS